MTSVRAWSRSVRPLAFFLSTSPMETSIAHSKCFFNLVYSPQTAPTRLVLCLTTAANDSEALAILFTAAPTASRLRQRSCWRVCVRLIRVSSLSVEPFRAATIDVIPTAKPVVEASRSVASWGSYASCILNLGDLDLSSSLPASLSSLSSLSAGDLMSSPCIWASWSSGFSDSVSTAPACNASGGFSETGNSPDAAGAAGATGAAAFA